MRFTLLIRPLPSCPTVAEGEFGLFLVAVPARILTVDITPGITPGITQGVCHDFQQLFQNDTS